MAKKLPDPEPFEGWVIGQKKNSKGKMVYAVGRHGIRNSRFHFNTREEAAEFVRLRNAVEQHRNNYLKEDPAKDEVEDTSETSDVEERLKLPLEVVDAIARWKVGFRPGVAIMLIVTNNIDNLEAAVDLLNHEIEQLRR